MRDYVVYIVTNPIKTVLYTGITNDIAQRLVEHYMERGKPSTFTGRYYCYNLLFYEGYQYVEDVIAREKEIKKWRRAKKEALITNFNPKWGFLNINILKWTPREQFHRKDL
ncbi:MAG: GIY-YIG nuclease family protein [Bacteroidetes bacterium]|nr:GIY-YIG nuclease family protein [Bacteroidota bacterium]